MSAILIVLVVVLIAFGFVRRCGAGKSTLANDFQKPADDTLAVAIEMSPLTYTLRHDTAEGFDYQILKAISQRHGIDMVFHPVSDLDRAFQGLYDKKYDLLVASIPSTKALKEYFPLTNAVYTDRQVLVQLRKDDGSIGIENQRGLGKDTVWIPDGAPFRTRLKNMAAEMGDTVVIESKPQYSAEQLVIMTALGQIPRAVVSERVAQAVAKDYPQLDISVPISMNQFQVWAVAPGDSVLLDSLNEWIGQFRRTAAYDALTLKYMSAPNIVVDSVKSE